MNRSPAGRGGRRGNNAPEQLPEVAHRLPVEVTFRASEEATRKFLTALGNSDQYFFDVRLGRVKNPAPIPSSGKKSSSTSPASDGGAGEIVVEGGESDIVVEGGNDIVVEGEEEAPAPVDLPKAPAKSEKILTKVSGNETLDVFLKLDLLIFIEEKEFPKSK